MYGELERKIPSLFGRKSVQYKRCTFNDNNASRQFECLHLIAKFCTVKINFYNLSIKKDCPRLILKNLNFRHMHVLKNNHYRVLKV